MTPTTATLGVWATRAGLDMSDYEARLEAATRWERAQVTSEVRALLDEHSGHLPANAARELAERSDWSARSLYRIRRTLTGDSDTTETGVPAAAGGPNARHGFRPIKSLASAHRTRQ